MFKSSSEPRLAIGFMGAFAALVVLAVVFYPLQNAAVMPGGQVAAVKVAWLAYAILIWYLLPVLLLCDARISATVRIAVSVLLVSMLSRGFVELYMMYVTTNWRPWMGIAHNLFTFSLMLLILLFAFRTMDKPYLVYLVVATAMFIPESGFAWYMLMNASDAGGAVYFVPGGAQHQWIMNLTWACVIALTLYLIFFLRQWLYGQTKR
jgi:hypothetical protein